ncbi:MAG TPA: hypothetical protein VGE74_15840 [Gemmata sp.]
MGGVVIGPYAEWVLTDAEFLAAFPQDSSGWKDPFWAILEECELGGAWGRTLPPVEDIGGGQYRRFCFVW